MSRRTSLREFQASLARRLAESASTTRKDLLGLQAGGNNWLIALNEAGEILPPPPLSPVPLCHPWMRGLANVRGTLYSVVDFSLFNGGDAILPAGNARLVLIGARHNLNCAILVSRAAGLRAQEDFEADPVSAADTARPWSGERLRDTQGRAWTRLQIPALLANPRFLEASLA